MHYEIARTMAVADTMLPNDDTRQEAAVRFTDEGDAVGLLRDLQYSPI